MQFFFFNSTDKRLDLFYLVLAEKVLCYLHVTYLLLKERRKNSL